MLAAGYFERLLELLREREEAPDCMEELRLGRFGARTLLHREAERRAIRGVQFIVGKARHCGE